MLGAIDAVAAYHVSRDPVMKALCGGVAVEPPRELARGCYLIAHFNRNTPMKHFLKLDMVRVSLRFPKGWGDTTGEYVDPRRLDEGKLSLVDILWKRWSELLEGNALGVSDDTRSFNIDCVTFEVLPSGTEENLDNTIDWVQQKLYQAYEQWRKELKEYAQT